MWLIIRLLINAGALYAAALLVNGIDLPSGFWSIALVALVFGLINALIKPVVTLMTLPLNLLTLGLFTLVINAFMLMLTGTFSGLTVVGFWPAFLGSMVISIVSLILSRFADEN